MTAEYKTDADRPRPAGECCPCSSGRLGRPASGLLAGQVGPGGMTVRMTAVGFIRPHASTRGAVGQEVHERVETWRIMALATSPDGPGPPMVTSRPAKRDDPGWSGVRPPTLCSCWWVPVQAGRDSSGGERSNKWEDRTSHECQARRSGGGPKQPQTPGGG